MEKLVKNIVELLGQPQNIVIVPHSNPDGDAIGSAIGLAIIFKNMGHMPKIISPNDYPDFLQWMSGDIEIINFQRKKKKAEKFIAECKLMFCVDFNDIKRTKLMEKAIENFAGKTVMIDHHPYPTDFADFSVSRPEYSSTCELVYDFIGTSGLSRFLNRQAAEVLYAGIMTDTGSFSYSTSRPNLYKVLSGLMEFDINTEEIHSKVYDNFSPDRMRLMGYCLLEKMVVLPEYRAGYISITLEELKKFNFEPGDTEGFVNIPLSIKGVIFSALFVEREDHVKISLRSKGSFPVNEFSSKHFGGGGHLNAAGGETKLKLTEILDVFTQLLPKYSHLLNGND